MTAIETSVAAVTVRVVDPETLPDVAEIVEVPAFRAEARPAALIVPVAVFEEAQVTVAGEILRAAIGVSAGRGELLGVADNHSRIRGSDRDRDQRRSGER